MIESTYVRPRNRHDVEENFREIIYYLRSDSPSRTPLICVCLMLDKATMTPRARGVSICSFLDPVDKRKGRALARQRARQALYREYSAEPICRNEAGTIISVVDWEEKWSDAEGENFGTGIVQYKSTFFAKEPKYAGNSPKLSAFETILVDKVVKAQKT